MLPTFCPPTIWAISLEFCKKTYILEADDFLGACYRKTMTPQKLWTLLLFSFWGADSDLAVPEGCGHGIKRLGDPFDQSARHG